MAVYLGNKAASFFKGSTAISSIYLNGVEVVIPPQAETASLLAAFAAASLPVPSTDAQTAYNRLYYRIKQAGVLSKLDRLFISVAEAEGHNRFDLVNQVSGLTATNQPTFTSNGGIFGDGTTQLYTSNFTPSTANGKFKQNDAFLAVYQLDHLNNNNDDCGNTNCTIRGSFRPSGDETMPARLNQGASSSFALPRSLVGAGLAWISRDGANTLRAGKSKTRLTELSAPSTSTALASTPILFGGGRVTANPNFSPRRLGALVIGQSLTDSEAFALSDALDEYMSLMLTTTLTLDVATTAQTLQGIGIELQSDSIEGDGGGIEESNKSSLPLDLSMSERARFKTEVMGLGAGFVDFRHAQGLYYRGTTADGKRFVERLPNQNAAIKDLSDGTGVPSCFTFWSPPPFYKKNTIGGTTYRGSTYPRPDPSLNGGADYNTWMRRLLQGGFLDAPDKATDPTGYAAWMTDFATNVVANMEYEHLNVARQSKFVVQNEPTNRTAYPSCEWTDQQMYDFLKAFVIALDASTILTTYNGQPNTVQIWSDDGLGANGVGGALIRADSALLSRISGWTMHKIDDCAKDANYITDNANSVFLLNSNGKPVNLSENEYFDLRLDPLQPTNYMEPAHRMANLAMQVTQAFRVLNSTAWYPIHVGKPSTGPEKETEGRAMTIWRPVGAPARSDYPYLQEGQFDFVKVNWHAIKGFLEHMPRGSVRNTFSAAGPRFERELYSMGWNKPNGKAVMAIVNRCRKANGVKLSGLPAGSYRRYRYDLNSASQDMGLITSGSRFNIPADTIEFIVQQ